METLLPGSLCQVPIKHNQYINNKCQITSHKSHCNSKQLTLCLYKDDSTFKEAELKAMLVGKKENCFIV